MSVVETQRPAIATTLRGRQLLSDSRINRGVAFSHEERAALGLTGLLPPAVLDLEAQVSRAYHQFQSQASDLGKNVFLSLLHDRNEVLFYRLLQEHLAEMLPIVYTPTVGEAIENFSGEFRGWRGVYLSIDRPFEIEASLRATGLGPDDVDLIVATDGEAILGIGDWGVGGIGISIGKLAVYTAAAGIDPTRAIPLVLDVGTNRKSLLEDPLYLGNRHERVDQDRYDAFVGAYVEAASRLFPHALLHWEDIGGSNATRILERYRDTHFTFNDDIQGTGAVALAALLSALQQAGGRICEQRVVIHGAGTAGIGIAEQLCAAMEVEGLASPQESFWALSSRGLITETSGSMRGFQRPFARREEEVAGFARDDEGRIGLLEVVRQVHPTVLIGTSGQPGSFGREVIEEMAAHCERPIVMPMSNPTSLSEAVPADLLEWTEGRALVATGSPFPPVTVGRQSFVVAQANNALVFPGLGLGGIIAGASRVTPKMLRAAAQAVAEQIDSRQLGSPLLPQVEALRETSAAVAAAVARTALAEGVASREVGDFEEAIRQAMWEPIYRPIEGV